MTLEETYKTYYKELYRFAYQLTQSSSDSKDLVQNVFLKYNDVSSNRIKILNQRAWLYKVLYNIFLTQSTNFQRRKTIETRIYSKQPGSYDPNEDYNKEELRKIMFEVIVSMQKKESVLLLLYYNGLKYAEIAEVLEINPNSIGKLLSRAIEKFVSIFKKEYNEMF